MERVQQGRRVREGHVQERAGTDNGSGRRLCTGRDGECVSREAETSGVRETRDLGKLCCHRTGNKIRLPSMFVFLTHRSGSFSVISLSIR